MLLDYPVNGNYNDRRRRLPMSHDGTFSSLLAQYRGLALQISSTTCVASVPSCAKLQLRRAVAICTTWNAFLDCLCSLSLCLWSLDIHANVQTQKTSQAVNVERTWFLAAAASYKIAQVC
jgi:hypothetical protein